MRQYILILTILTLLFSLALTGCTNKEADRRLLFNKAYFAEAFGFELRLCEKGQEFWENSGRVFTPLNNLPIFFIPSEINPSPPYNSLVFVHKEAEAANFSDDVLVAWPNEVVSTRMLRGINYLIRHEMIPELELEIFGLSYPLTMYNLVDDWEEMVVFWREISFRDTARTWILETSFFNDENFLIAKEFFPNPEYERQLGWVRRTIWRSDISATEGFKLFRTSGSSADDMQAFGDIMRRISEEGLSVEEALKILEAEDTGE